MIRLPFFQRLDDAVGPRPRPVVGRCVDADQHLDRTFRWEFGGHGAAERETGQVEVLPDEGETRIALAALEIVDIGRDHRDTGVRGFLDHLIERVVVDDGDDDHVGALRDRRLDVGNLALDVVGLAGEQHLTVGGDQGAGIVIAFFDRQPERIAGVSVRGKDYAERRVLGEDRAG